MAVNSLELSTKIFWVTCTRETLINDGRPDGLREVKEYIPWIGKVKRKRVRGNWRYL